MSDHDLIECRCDSSCTANYCVRCHMIDPDYNDQCEPGVTDDGRMILTNRSGRAWVATL